MTNPYRQIKDLTNHQFGKLTVTRNAANTECTISQLTEPTDKWLCQCTCGRTAVVSRKNLITGHTTSCGCSRYDKDKDIENKISSSFGEKRIRNIWQGIKARCYSKLHPKYQYYGGKGITLCQEWLDSFEAFKAWALSNGYADNLTIDRIEVSGNYCPDNCRWMTFKDQQSNKSNNIPTTTGLSLRAECERRGLNYNTIRMRLVEGDYTIEEVLNSKMSNKFYYGGKSMEQWCVELDIGCSKVKTRMCRKKENFRDALLYYACMNDDRKKADFIMSVIPVDKDPGYQYYKPRSEEYRMKRKERLEKNKLFKGESV